MKTCGNLPNAQHLVEQICADSPSRLGFAKSSSAARHFLIKTARAAGIQLIRNTPLHQGDRIPQEARQELFNQSCVERSGQLGFIKKLRFGKRHWEFGQRSAFSWSKFRRFSQRVRIRQKISRREAFFGRNCASSRHSVDRSTPLYQGDRISQDVRLAFVGQFCADFPGQVGCIKKFKIRRKQVEMCLAPSL